MENGAEGVGDGDAADSDRDLASTVNTDGGPSSRQCRSRSDDSHSDVSLSLSDNPTHFLVKEYPHGDRGNLPGIINDMVGEIAKSETGGKTESLSPDLVDRVWNEMPDSEDGDSVVSRRPHSLFEMRNRDREDAGEGYSPQTSREYRCPPSGPFVAGDQIDIMTEAFTGRYMDTSHSGGSGSLLMDSGTMQSSPSLDPSLYLSPTLLDKMKWIPHTPDQGSSFPPLRRQQKVRTDLSLRDRVRLINMSETTGKSQRCLAAEFHISVGSVNNILRRKREYLEAFERKEKQPNSKNFCFVRPAAKPSSFSELHMLIVRWLEIARIKMKPLSWPVILEKAREFAARLNVPHFTSTAAWLEQLKQSLDIPSPLLQHSKSLESDARLLTMWQKMLPFLVQGYASENIFTVTETALYYRCLPDRCLTGEPVCKGAQSHADLFEHRLTVLLCCNALGERLKPLVISRDAHPASLAGVRMTDLPVVWCHHADATMTTDIFGGWLRSLDAAMGQQQRQIALFMDMTPSHLASVLLKNTSLKFYLDNSSHLLQPLNQGVVRSFKGYYRRRLLQAMLARATTNDSCHHALESITELDAIFWIQEAWRTISTETISACFQTAAFPLSTDPASTDRGGATCQALPPDLPILVQKNSRVFKFTPMSVDVFVEFDSQLPCHHGDTEDWENSLLAEAVGRRIKSEPVDGAGEDADPGTSRLAGDEKSPTSVVRMVDALECLWKLKRFSSSSIGLLTTVYELEGLILDSLDDTQPSASSVTYTNSGLERTHESGSSVSDVTYT